MKKESLKEITLDLKNPFKSKLFVKFLVGSLVLVGTAVGTYRFADTYRLEFQSPVVFRNPIIVYERSEDLIVPVVVEEEVVKEATESAQVQVKEFSPSKRLVQMADARPDIYGKIKKVFGDDSMIMGELIARESSFNPEAVNPSSGACGLGQALPCEKMQCEVSEDDADCQLEWIKEYVESRYGDAQTALAFHDRNGWY